MLNSCSILKSHSESPKSSKGFHVQHSASERTEQATALKTKKDLQIKNVVDLTEDDSFSCPGGTCNSLSHNIATNLKKNNEIPNILDKNPQQYFVKNESSKLNTVTQDCNRSEEYEIYSMNKKDSQKIKENSRYNHSYKTNTADFTDKSVGNSVQHSLPPKKIKLNKIFFL